MLITVTAWSTNPRDRHQETRAVWFSTGNEYNRESSKNINTILQEYEKMHITQLFWFNNLKESKYRASSFQLLDTLISRAHQKGMKIHPVYSPGSVNSPDEKNRMKKEWLIVGMNGDTLQNMNLANPEVQQYILSDLAEYLKHPIDGIHLDFIRFPTGQGFSYDKLTIQAFKKKYGQSPLDGKHDSGSMTWCRWIRWNAEQITTLVEKIRKLMKASGQDLLLSAAVFPDYELALSEIGQDWKTWTDKKLIDIICPMLYTSDTSLFREYVERSMNIVDGKAILLPGIATSSVHNTSSPEDVVRQVEICLNMGTDGVCFFRLGVAEMPYIEKLKLSVFK